MESSAVKWPEKGQIRRSHSITLCNMASDSAVLLLAGKLKANKRRQELGICSPQDVADAKSLEVQRAFYGRKMQRGSVK